MTYVLHFDFVDERNCSFMGRGLEEASSWKSEVPFLEGNVYDQARTQVFREGGGVIWFRLLVTPPPPVRTAILINYMIFYIEKKS